MPLERLIFVNCFFHPDESATSQILSDLAFYLAENGRRVIVISGRSQLKGDRLLPASEEIRNVQVHRVWSTRMGSLGLAGKAVDYLAFYLGVFVMMLRLVRSEDVVIAKTDPPMLGNVAALVVRLRGARLINWLQDLYPEVASALGVPGLKGRVGGLLARLRDRALRRSACNVVIGRRMGERLQSRGIAADRIRIIPNWTDEAAIRPIATEASAARREWGLIDDLCVIGYSGNLGRAHETRTLVEAAHRLHHRTDILFLFIGGGRESDLLRSRVETEGLSNFLFKPHQPRARLSDSLAAADVHWLSLRPELEGLIVPSKFYGIAAAGRPVLAVVDPDGEIGTLVRETKCGLVVAPGDGAALAEAIESLADDPMLRLEMGARSRSALDSQWARRIAFSRWEALLDSAALLGEAESVPAIAIGA